MVPRSITLRIFSVSSHHPFRVPEKYEGVFPKGTLPLHQCVGYTDLALRKFFDLVKEEPWYERTIFVLTADHSVPAHFAEYKTNVNGFAVPIVLHAPGLGLQGLNHDLAQQTDILPTVLSLLDYPHPYVAFGKNLMEGTQNGERFVLNFVNETFQFLMNEWALYFDGKQVVAFYDRLADPLLTRNLKNERPLPVEEVAFMKAVIQQYNNRMIEDRLTVVR